ncbi:MAG: HAMP domain-containing histidine kinase [Lachnospiraceae bacterium]|nr:HAMP domain-containing histidine kinase [Lachnospiraceae bacterium]
MKYSIKNRMRTANLFLALLPLISTVVAVLIVGAVVWKSLGDGIQLGANDEEGFGRTCQVIYFMAEEKIKSNKDLDGLDQILEKNSISARITNGNEIVYENIVNDTSLTSEGMNMYVKGIYTDDTAYYLYLYGKTENEVNQTFEYLFAGLILLIIIVPIISYWIATKIMADYVYSGINDFIGDLAQATTEIENGNLSYRMNAQDIVEFENVSSRVNEMTAMLEQADRKMTERFEHEKNMVRDIFHDIKSPLSSIVFAIGAIKDDVVSSESEKEDLLEMVLEKSADIDKLLSAILERFRIDSADEKNFENINLKNTVEEFLESHKADYKNRGVQFKTSLSDLNIIGDKEMIFVILDNIISNTIKYRTKDESIVEIRLDYSGERECRLMICDDGPGVDEKELEKITQPFYRCDSARHNTAEGNGLGLAIVDAAVKKMNGKMKLSNAEGLKTEIFF